MRFANKTNVFSFYPVTSSRPPASAERQNRERGARAFIISEALQEGAEEDSDSNDDEDEQPTAQDAQFIAGDDDEEEALASTPSEHRRLDAALMEQEAERVMPYFPRAFAVSEERPLQFNFNLFLLDCLDLPRHIHARDSQEPNPSQAVVFTNVAGAIAYCTERLERGWRRTASSQQEPLLPSARLSHPGVDKWALFRSDGKRLTKSLQSGQPALDENLNKVRLDR